jgi:predicted RNA binding protein YcfA (HicA-like mRNA interferase family)
MSRRPGRSSRVRLLASQWAVKVRDVRRLLADDGWVVVRQAGSHRQLKHPTKPGRVTVSGNRNDDLAPKTPASVLRQAGLEETR